MKSVGIIGFGRFGKVLANILQKGYHIRVYEPKHDPSHSTHLPEGDSSKIEFIPLKEIFQEKVIFIAVPINRFEDVIKEIAGLLTEEHTIVDVCSVKIHPVSIMEQYLPKTVGIIATHPLFGPDSFMNREMGKLKMMMHWSRDCQMDVKDAEKPHYQFNLWKNFFHHQGIEIVEITPDTHDQLAAQTQGLTHYLGRILKEFGIKKTPIDTSGFADLLDLVEQTCNDSWELYQDLQKYNPYTQKMIEKIDRCIEQLNQRTSIS